MKKILIGFVGILIAFATAACTQQTIEHVTVKRASVIHLRDVPPSIDAGKIGDYYIDKSTGLLYGPKTDERGWGNTPIRIVSEKGIQPNTIRSGEGYPKSDLGNLGDLYLDTKGAKLYGPKTSAGWGNGYALGDSNPWIPTDLPNYKISDDGTKLLSWLNHQTLHIDMRNDVKLSRISAIKENAFSYTYGSSGHEGVFYTDRFAVKSIIVAPTVTEIGHHAFEGLSFLESITLPKGIRLLPKGVFNGCIRLKSVNLEEGIEEIADFAFGGCKIESIRIPRSVKKIGGYAFASCTELTELQLQEGLKEIANLAFVGCTGLKELEIPESISKMGDFCFMYAPVETVVLHSRTIPEWPYYNVSFVGSLKTLYVPDESLSLYKSSKWCPDTLKAKMKPLSERPNK
nr:leucine-rich repeat domain-containing protein [uncultured Capnocytophaga sp.]